jgi:hypothetical protein
MKCKVCKNDVEQGRAKCPLCGFPMLQMVQGSEAEQKKADEMAENYRKKLMQPVKIGLKVYTNAMDNGNLTVKKEEYITLAEGLSLAGSEIIWYPEKFARQTGECMMKIAITDTKGNKKDQNIVVANPNIMDFWQVGVQPLEGFSFRIVLGKMGDYAVSDTLSCL